MDFKPEKTGEFITFFNTIKGKIANFPGCNHVELCKDAGFDHVLYTFSEWDDEAALEAYRKSALFEDAWTKTKAMFGGKPQAYSLIQD